jgi:pimeloyl-ACP methyl ester carboxylesterase
MTTGLAASNQGPSTPRVLDSERARLMQGWAGEPEVVRLNGTMTSLLSVGMGPPLILLHGGIECGGTYWAPVVARLAKRFQVLIPDVPGLGESEPFDELNDAAFARWFDELLRATGALHPVLVAHSLLGSLAARYAVQRGERLGRLVLYGAPGIGPYRMPIKLLIAALRFQLRPTARNKQRFERFALLDRDRTRQRDAEWFDAFSSYGLSCALRPHTKRTMKQLIPLGTMRISDEELQRIVVPTVLLWGERDRMVAPALATRAHERFDWPLSMVPDAAHVPHMEQPELFLKALLELLRDA